MTTSFRIFLVAAVALGGATYWFLGKLSDRVERQYLEAAEEPMVDAAHLLASVAGRSMDEPGPLGEALASAHGRAFVAEVYNVTKTEVGMHAYLTDADGVVLFDTARPGAVGESYLDHRDVFLTLHGQYGARSSRDDELNDRSSVMFVGAPVLAPDGSVAGVLTVSKPQAAMFEFIHETRRFIRHSGFLFVTVVLAAIALALEWFSRPIERLVAYAEAVRRGERPSLKRSRNPEAAALGDAIEDMRHALEDRNYVETYVQTLTHEMKSPVAGIRGAAELLAEPSMPEERRQRFLTNIQNETERLQSSIDRLLALSAIEGRPSLGDGARPVDLSALVTRVADNYAEVLAAKRVALRLEVEPGLAVRGDEFIVEMATSNLLQNAADFAPAGSEVTVRLAAEPGGRTAALTVADQGPGVPDYALPRVFDRFYSLQHPDTGRKSSGLGLCFVREAAQLHGGTAALANGPEGAHGATATLTLPLA